MTSGSFPLPLERMRWPFFSRIPADFQVILKNRLRRRGYLASLHPFFLRSLALFIEA